MHQPLDVRAAASARGDSRSSVSRSSGADSSPSPGVASSPAAGGGGASGGAASDPRLSAALDFKKDKSADYSKGKLQGVCNTMATSEVAKEFVVAGGKVPPNDVRRIQFDALVIAEGEWSTTCNLRTYRLGSNTARQRGALPYGHTVPRLGCCASPVLIERVKLAATAAMPLPL